RVLFRSERRSDLELTRCAQATLLLRSKFPETAEIAITTCVVKVCVQQKKNAKLPANLKIARDRQFGAGVRACHLRRYHYSSAQLINLLMVASTPQSPHDRHVASRSAIRTGVG